MPLSVPGPDQVAQPPVSSGGACAFHPWMLIGRNRLTVQLPTDPTADLAQDHGTTKISGGQCRGDTAAAASDDEYVAGQLHGIYSLVEYNTVDRFGSSWSATSMIMSFGSATPKPTWNCDSLPLGTFASGGPCRPVGKSKT